MFVQDLSNANPTTLVRIDIRSIEYHKYSLFNIQYSFPASPAWDFGLNGHRAESKEHRAESIGQRAESREYGAEGKAQME